MAVVAERPRTAPLRGAAAPLVVKASAGAPAKEAVTGRDVSAYSWDQPRRNTRFSFSRQPASMLPPIWAPRTERSDWVVCWATLRLSESAPVSVKAAWVEVEAWSRAKGVTKASARPPSPIL